MVRRFCSSIAQLLSLWMFAAAVTTETYRITYGYLESDSICWWHELTKASAVSGMTSNMMRQYSETPSRHPVRFVFVAFRGPFAFVSRERERRTGMTKWCSGIGSSLLYCNRCKTWEEIVCLLIEMSDEGLKIPSQQSSRTTVRPTLSIETTHLLPPWTTKKLPVVTNKPNKILTHDSSRCLIPTILLCSCCCRVRKCFVVVVVVQPKQKPKINQNP